MDVVLNVQYLSRGEWAMGRCGDRRSDLVDMSHLLAVDDEPPIRELAADTFRLEGFSVATAGDGFEALTAAHRAAPDVVIVDLMMPRMDGHAFLRAFRSVPEFAATPVVIVSAVQAELDQATSLVHAGRLKPFDLDDLVQTVRGLVHG